MVAKKRLTYKKLGEILVCNGVIDQEQLDEALSIQKHKDEPVSMGEILVELGFAEETDIMSAFTSQYQIPYLPVSHYKIDVELIRIIPVEIAKKYLVIPLERIGKYLTVAMANPLNVHKLKELKETASYFIHVLVSSPSDIKSKIEEHYNVRISKNVPWFPLLPHDYS